MARQARSSKSRGIEQPDEWDRPSNDEFVADCQELLDLIDGASEEVKEKSEGFFGDVEDQAMDIKAKVESGATVTEGRVRAIKNWKEAIQRWLEHE